jgi:hypothetical protein
LRSLNLSFSCAASDVEDNESAAVVAPAVCLEEEVEEAEVDDPFRPGS